MKAPPTVAGAQPASAEVEKKNINAELWQACAGPLVNLPAAGTQVVYFPQGHSEQVAASLKKSIDSQIPNYPNLPSKLLCILHNITLHADPETDEVYAQMTLQPTPSFDKNALLRSDLSMKINKPQTEFFCKTLTASDTSTHGGFSVPRRAAEKIFPTLDFTMLPPAQELVARDLHDNVWTFRHIYRGQPKRHLLTTGWSLFVSGKRLFAGDSVLFIRDKKQQLLLGIRRANRQPMNLSSSMLSSDSMHIGILAAAAHATANNSPFTVFYNPRASPSEFVIPLAKYYKATCSNQISLGMRFRMTFETEESGTRRYMGTITGISDLDPVGWKNSQWRSLQVGWDESTAGERRTRVSLWEIEPMTTPFFLCPTPPLVSLKRPRLPGMADDYSSDIDTLFRRTMPWLGDDFGLKDSQSQTGMSLVQWMNTKQNPPGPNSVQLSYTSSAMQSLTGSNNLHQLGLPETRFNSQMQLNHFGSITQPQQHNDTQSVPSDHANNQLHVAENQIQQLQLQQQSLLAQQSVVQQQSQDNHQVIDAPQSHSVAQQMVRNDTQTNIQFAQTTPQLKQVVPELPVYKAHSRNSSAGTAGGGQSAVTDDVPSCSVSPSSNNCAGGSQQLMTGGNLCMETTRDKIVLSSAVLSNPCGLEIISSSGDLGKGFQHKSNVRPSLNVSRDQSHSVFASPVLINPSENQIDYVDSSSSVTSVLSQNEAQIPEGNTPNMPFDSQPLLFRHGIQDTEIWGSSGSNTTFGVSIDDQMGVPMLPESLRNDFPTNLSSDGGMLAGYNDIRQPQPELLSSMISQPFGVADMAFNSINSTMNNGSFMNSSGWAPPQIPRMRTFTKVYKRGAVGRSIDITSYSGYDELKQDLARRFGIQGQLEDWQRIGWKLVYIDHENDVLLVGDDPWEEFVNCVRCIKILSPQEFQQMSLEGDIVNNGIIPNQACSSSDNGVS